MLPCVKIATHMGTLSRTLSMLSGLALSTAACGDLSQHSVLIPTIATEPYGADAAPSAGSPWLMAGSLDLGDPAPSLPQWVMAPNTDGGLEIRGTMGNTAGPLSPGTVPLILFVPGPGSVIAFAVGAIVLGGRRRR